ncbi:hypothetical protein [Pseudomonas sp. NW5]|uniref:hypothetical protein n=1 Tax=Pseudomonas sp. NW5 TaxID=2934934 RepID=UPI002020D6EE|nr:hypothetical protein [Pseudomonas sp. NW5]MCL7463373.1 hypothetical protein [Pseudomonas sp. NW5]
MNDIWQALCEVDGLDPQQRLAARQAILAAPEALDCSLYRADEGDEDAEEEDLGDARILFQGPFVAPREWDAAACAAYYDETDPALFCTALIECLADPQSRQFFTPEVGDYVAVVTAEGLVEMYYLYDWQEDDHGRRCVLIRDEVELD